MGNSVILSQVGSRFVTFTPPIPVYHPQVVDWANRVIANGGAYPSTNTLSAFDTFYRSIVLYGLDTKLKAVNCYAPDNIVAATTPFIKTLGNDPWTNYQFTASTDLTVYGLKGGTNEYLDSGVPSNAFATNSIGATIYASEITASLSQDLGDGAAGGAGAFQISLNHAPLGGNTALFDWPLGVSVAGRITFTMNSGSGYFCCVRSDGSLVSVYYANTNKSHSLVATNTNTLPNYTNARSLMVHARNNSNLVVDQFSSDRLGFVAFHTSMSKEDSANLYNSVQTLRNQIISSSAPAVGSSIGGSIISPVSFVVHPQVLDWATRVVSNGGSYPSQRTVEAVSIFYSELSQNGLLSKMKAVNCFVPDNLIASITPLVKTYGLDPWTNNNFVSGDLTVNGLVGNASDKRLETGLIPSTIYSLGSLGVSLYVHTNTYVFGYDTGVFGSLQTSYWIGLSTNYSNGNNLAWTDCSATGLYQTPSGLGGFYSGNRISITDSRMYFGNSTNAFAQTGSVNTDTAIALPTVNTFPVFCVRAQSSTPFQYSNHRISFAAYHDGLTAIECQQFYNLVQKMRERIGGGWV